MENFPDANSRKLQKNSMEDVDAYLFIGANILQFIPL